MLPSFCVTFLLITSYILPVSIFLETLKTKNSKYLIFGRKWWSTLLIIHEKSIFHHLYGSILCKIEIQPFYLFHWKNYLKNFSQIKQICSFGFDKSHFRHFKYRFVFSSSLSSIQLYFIHSCGQSVIVAPLALNHIHFSLQ